MGSNGPPKVTVHGEDREMRLKSGMTLCLLIGQTIQLSPVLAADPPIVIEGAWVREAPPVSKVLAGYMNLVNRTAQPASVRTASSPDFDRVEFHRSMVVDGMARMKPENRLVVPSRGRMVLEPGGRHLMLIGPMRSLTSGDTVTVILTLEDGREVEVAAPVRRDPPK